MSENIENTIHNDPNIDRFVETIGGITEGRVIAHHKTAIDIREEAEKAATDAKETDNS